MPSIATAAIPITDFPNKYISPYGNDGIIPLYSSIPILSSSEATGCLPCVICGNSSSRKEINEAEALSFKEETANGVIKTLV